MTPPGAIDAAALARLRADTPGVNERIHLNNCGAALMPRPVLEAQVAHLEREARIGGYEAAGEARLAVEATYDEIAALLGARREEIAVVENATRAWDMAFYALQFRAGDEILTARAEYASNYIAFLQVARRTGAVVRPVPDDASGQLDVAALARMIGPRTRLVAVTHVPTNGGLVNPAAAIGAVARAHGVPFLLDACQSAGQLPLDVDGLGIDLLSATGRKFLRGPRGVGFLYVREPWIERLEPPFLDLHAATWTGPETYALRADARRFETWEGNVAAKIGLGVAVAYARSVGLEAIARRVGSLAERFRTALRAIPGVTVHDRGTERCGIVSFTHRAAPARALVLALAEERVNVSVSGASSTLLDMRGRGLAELVRAGVHYYNTEDELDRVAELVARH